MALTHALIYSFRCQFSQIAAIEAQNETGGFELCADGCCKVLMDAVFYHQDTKSLRIIKADDGIIIRLDQLDEILNKFDEPIENVFFTQCDSLKFETLIRILGQVCNIKKLTIEGNELNMDELDSGSLQQLEMTRLEKLTIISRHQTKPHPSSIGYVKLTQMLFLKALDVAAIELSFQVDTTDGNLDQYADLRQIIGRRENLKSLILNDLSFFNGPFDNSKLQLDTFLVVFGDPQRSETANYDGYVEFLKTQTVRSMQDLNFLCFDNNINESLKNAFAAVFSSPALRIGSVFNIEQSQMMSDLSQNISNPHVEHHACGMTVEGYWENHKSIINGIVKMFPNLKELYYNGALKQVLGTFDPDIFVPLNTLHNLQGLDLNLMGGFTLEQVSKIAIPSLKNIEIQNSTCDLHELDNFIFNNPQMENFTIQFPCYVYQGIGLLQFIENALNNCSIVCMDFDISHANETFKRLLTTEESSIQGLVNLYAKEGFYEIKIFFDNKLFKRFTK